MKRGQATVELALGSLVFITILTVGIHLSEASFAALKVQEASQAALWDATAYRMHEMCNQRRPGCPGGYSTRPASSAVAIARTRVTNRYRDLDGRMLATRPSFSGVFTRARNVAVSCTMGGAPADPRAANPLAGAAYQDNGGMSCSSQARVDSIGAMAVPRSFLDTGGGALFQQRNWSGASMTLCGLGRATLGVCRGRYTMMIDDWGLADVPGGRENGQCLGGTATACAGRPTGNLPFYRAAQRAYQASLVRNGLDGSNPLEIPATWLARWMMLWSALPFGASPYDETGFNLSYVGEEGDGSRRPFEQRIMSDSGNRRDEPGGAAYVNWNATPYSDTGKISNPSGRQYQSTYGGRTQCYLGRGC